jgi:hypothetical protein
MDAFGSKIHMLQAPKKEKNNLKHHYCKIKKIYFTLIVKKELYYLKYIAII